MEHRLSEEMRLPVSVLADDVATVFGAFKALASDMSPAHPADVLALTSEEGGAGVVFPTAGTTGTPKLIFHSAEGIERSLGLVRHGFRSLLTAGPRGLARSTSLVWRKKKGLVQALRGRKVWMTPLPLYRISGYSIMMGALLTGEAFVIADGVSPSTMAHLLDRAQTTIAPLSPLQAELLLRAARKTGGTFRHLLVIGLGADITTRDLAIRVERAFGCKVVVGYGSTELGGGVLAAIQCPRSAPDGFVGRPFKGVEARIVDDSGKVVNDGTVGRLECKVPRAILGIELLGAATFSPEHQGVEDQGWHITGDRAYVDAKGNVVIAGRADDVIVRSGENVDPAVVEALLNTHFAVRQSGVVSGPSPFSTSHVWAFCELEPAHIQAVDDVRAFVRTLSTPIDRVVTVAALPLTAEGKVRRAVLRQWASGAI